MNKLALGLLVTALVVAPFGAVGGASTAAKYDDHLLDALAAGIDPVRVIVTTTGDPAPAAAAARLSGASVTWTYSIIDGFAATLPAALLDDVAARADVEKVWLDRPVKALMDVSARAIEADRAWAAGYDGAGVTVAVIDTGIDMLHPYLAGAVVRCVSTVGGLTTPECTDSDGHGTHVAGTVASRDDVHRGVAPGASLAVVRVLHAAGSGTSADIVAGMDWVRANKDLVSPRIRVATMSIGYLEPGCGDDSNPEARAANALVASGVVFTVAAGNSGHRSCTIDGASAASGVTTIAAVDDRGTVGQGDDVIASFSSGGPTKDGRLKPDVAYPGVAITSAFIGAGALVATMDGTSMATPHAAGTAALLLQKEPTLTAAAVKDRLLTTAVKTDKTGSTANVVYGHGLGNACAALRLAGCATVAPPTPPTPVHVRSIGLAFDHGTGKTPPHRVHTTVSVVDDAGAAVSGATVAIEVVSPEGTKHTATGSTGATGEVTLMVTQKGGGHGTWRSCVTGVSGTNLAYASSKNVETCDTIVVS